MCVVVTKALDLCVYILFVHEVVVLLHVRPTFEHYIYYCFFVLFGPYFLF